MDKDFLGFLDTKQLNYIQKNGIKNKWFIDYTLLESRDLVLEKQYYIAKAQKSRVLINHSNIWVDLTDYDMINIFCKMKEETATSLLAQLKEGYNGNWSSFSFEIDSVAFKGLGVNYKKFNLNEEIMLEADFEIKLKDILFILNMILYKDIIGQKYLEKELPCKLIERNIIKYISLVLNYKFQQKQALEYLNSISYPVYSESVFLNKKMQAKKYDNRFQINGFEKLLALC